MSANVTLPAPPTTLREKLAQLITVRIGSNLPPVRTVEEDGDRVAQLMESCPIGGLVLFNGRRETTPAVLDRLQRQSRYPLLVGSDLERGTGQQLRGYEMFPHAMAFDALGAEAEEVVEQFAWLTAKTAREAGIHVVFAPVADVNVDPRNPIIATRAFGTEPERVARLVANYVRGAKRGGLLATAKHFPGHGNTHEDSHHALPSVNESRGMIETCELVPFRAAIAERVPLVMTAHVQYPAYDSSGQPATLSAPILNELLRDQLGFQGAVVSDSLLMEGVKQGFPDEGALVVAALRAGVDLLLDVADAPSVLDALQQAVEQSVLSEVRVEEAFQHVWQLKKLAFQQPAATQQENSDKETKQLAGQIARRAIVQVCGRDFPMSSAAPLCALLISPYESHLDSPEQPLGDALRSRFKEVEYYELRPSSDPDLYAKVLASAQRAEQTLVAMIVKPAAWHRFGLREEQLDLVRQLAYVPRCVIASLGSPEALRPIAGLATQLCAYSDVPASQIALADYLLSAESEW